jgi:hypothetical protein
LTAGAAGACPCPGGWLAVAAPAAPGAVDGEAVGACAAVLAAVFSDAAGVRLQARQNVMAIRTEA